MKRFGLFLLGMIFVSALTGCLSLSNTPAPRFYMLRSIDKAQVVEKFNFPSDAIIVIGPVKVPGYQDRPQIVTQDKDKMLTFAQFDRWGEHLDQGLARVILENLNLILPGATLEMFPCNFAIPVKYQVLVDVLKLESELEKEVFFVAQWSIIDLDSRKMLFTKRTEFRQTINPQSYSGLAEALSAACASLSSEIAGAMAPLVTHPGPKGEVSN